MRVSFYTIGCRLNQAETAVIEASFRNNGHQIVDANDAADVVVIHTCTVTAKGDADTQRIVNKAVRLNPTAKIALIGCQAQTQKEALFKMPNIHWIVGNERKMDLAEIVGTTLHSEPQLITPLVQKKNFTIPFTGIDHRHTRANLKIQDGCNFFCTYCEIPYARGRARSRVFTDILREARELAAAGYREIVLTGVNIGTYTDEDKTLLDVVDALQQIPGLDRIRISSAEGTTLSPELFQRMKEGKLCRHLHISIQSAQDDILQAMNRRYSVSDFDTFINKAVQIVDLICLGTDVIVGFPGESDEKFITTFQNLEQMPLAYFHVFSYSERGHAASRKLPHKIPPAIIEKRSRILRQLSSRKRRVFFEKNIGLIQPVLFEQKKNGWWSGLTDNYIRVKVKSDRPTKNQLLPVKLTHIDSQNMIGILDA
ncbi:MAG: tRNA (N(6)-L-threonylcarbamoyladenosine(37)-C(2))-methylthiotransferase MtaB [Calditrichaeota bacterium]|nr:MAG: tRNA (N(6)-L-threonylcarbamoyladenosine(37)-C(2))-methylthiotransferase MtaB [Calditrichota bacterium]